MLARHERGLGCQPGSRPKHLLNHARYTFVSKRVLQVPLSVKGLIGMAKRILFRCYPALKVA